MRAFFYGLSWHGAWALAVVGVGCRGAGVRVVGWLSWERRQTRPHTHDSCWKNTRVTKVQWITRLGSGLVLCWPGGESAPVVENENEASVVAAVNGRLHEPGLRVWWVSGICSAEQCESGDKTNESGMNKARGPRRRIMKLYLHIRPLPLFNLFTFTHLIKDDKP